MKTVASQMEIAQQEMKKLMITDDVWSINVNKHTTSLFIDFTFLNVAILHENGYSLKSIDAVNGISNYTNPQTSIEFVVCKK